MTEAFIKAAEDKGHTVTRFDAAMKQLADVMHARHVLRLEKACSFDDVFNMNRTGNPGSRCGCVQHTGLLVFDPGQIKGV